MFEILRDWRIEKKDPNSCISKSIIIQKTKQGFERRSKWLKEPIIFRDPIDTICDLIVDLVNAYIEDNEGLLCLHCAAVEFYKGIVDNAECYNLIYDDLDEAAKLLENTFGR